MNSNLEFRGKWSDIFGPALVIALARIFTLGIAVPWAFIAYRRRILGLTYYRGYPLAYDGSGGEYFGEIIIGFLLTLITVGFYSFLGFYQARLIKYDIQHTILPGGKRLQFRANGIDFFGQYLLIGFLTGITCGIYFFWGYARMRRFIIEHSSIDGRPLNFIGTGGQYLGHSIIIALLTFITIGFYAFLCAGAARITRWDAEKTIIPEY
jgi:uncharacterized membrane protein YjgN (DUF898 family)